MNSNKLRTPSSPAVVPLVFRTANGYYLPETLHAIALDFLPAADFLSLFHVSPSSNQLTRRHLSSKKSFVIDNPTVSPLTMHFAMNYAQYLHCIKLLGWDQAAVRLHANDLADLITKHASTLQDVDVFGKNRDVIGWPYGSFLLQALGTCSSLRSVKLGRLDNGSVGMVQKLVALPSLRSLHFTSNSSSLREGKLLLGRFVSFCIVFG